MPGLSPESCIASFIGFVAASRHMSRLIASQLPGTASQVHRLLIERNLNTGGKNYDESKGVVAHNAVHHSKQYPSELKITVVKK